MGKGKPESVGKPSAGEGVEIEDRVSKLSKQFGMTLADGVTKSVLDPMDNSASTGIATLEDSKGAQLITVLANLPDIEKKETYTAQLIGSGKPILLGKLSVAKGGWMLEREVNIDVSAYKTVEVLKGTQVILRGVFK